MSDWHINVGDDVRVSIDSEGHVVIYGVVRSMPCATGDVWVIENEQGPHYIQQFAYMNKSSKVWG